MDNLSDKMRTRLEKWRKNTIPVASAEKVRDNPQIYVARKEYGDEFEEEALLQEQRNRSNNGQRASGSTAR